MAFVHAAPLHERGGTGGGPIGVVLGPARPDQLTSLRLDLHGMTDRESEVAQLLARGDSIDEIASVLWISRHTVKDHIKAIYGKLGVRSRSELAATLFYQHYLPTLGPDRFHEDTPDKQPTAKPWGKMTTPPVIRPPIRAGQNLPNIP